MEPLFKQSNMFPIPVVTCQWYGAGDFNKELKQTLYEARASDPEGIYRSNMAGTWHSKDMNLGKAQGPLKQLGVMYAQCFSQLARAAGSKPNHQIGWDLQAWCMMYKGGGYATPHNHPNCHFAGVYYVDGVDVEAPEKVMATGVKVRDGDIEFINPHASNLASKEVVLQPAFRLTPKTGLMLAWPAWVNHFVHPVTSEEYTRIAVACNASIGNVKEVKQ